MVLTQWETLCGLFFAFFEKIVVPILTSGGVVDVFVDAECGHGGFPFSPVCGQEKTQHLPAFGKRCVQTGKPAVSWHSNGSTAYF